MNIRIALCEDEDLSILHFKEQVARYESEHDVRFTVDVYTNPIQLLDNYKANHDIIFMDIMMPFIDGMEASRRLRVLDPDVLLIFLTSLTQYAVEGYSVDAFDYLVKPVQYFDFALKLSRAINKLPDGSRTRIIIQTEEGKYSILPSNILYIETDGHHLIYHTVNGDFRQYGSMSELVRKLHNSEFAQCSQSYLVNLRYVHAVKGFDVTMDDCVLRISQPKRKAFYQTYKAYTQHNQ